MTPLELTYDPVGDNGTVKLTAKLGAELLACEKIDLLRVKHRESFASRLCDGRGLERSAVDAELTRLAATLANKPTSTPMQDVPELEHSAIVRAELFHAVGVSGLTVPVRSALGSEARARWCTYLRFTDGRRERRELSPTIDLSDGRRLWVHPVPGEPTPTMQAAWSAEARRAWLSGAAAPDPIKVFKAICERIAYYLDFAPDLAAGTTAMLALWIIFTYAFPAWPAVPYLFIGGPLGSGKSTLFAVLSRIVFRSIQSSSMTGPCLFRMLHDHGGTLLLDEAERLRDGTPDAGDLRSILLSGYKAGSPARRLEKVGDGFQQVAFDVFGPKALASIANPPEALASRCLRLTMFRAGPDSPKPRRRIDADPAIWQSVRNDLHALALEHGPTWLTLSAFADVVPASLAGRDYELWQPMLALAAWLDKAGVKGLLMVMQEHAESVTADGRDDATPDADETLLRIVAEAVIDGRHYATKAADVLRRAKELDAVTFEKWSPKGVGSALARYGLRTAKGRGNTGRTFAKVTSTALRRIEAAYGLDLGLPDVPTSTEHADEPALDAGKTG